MDPNLIAQLITDQQFKPFWPYLKLARDCLANNPLISYWALYYVLDQGIRAPKQDDTYKKALGTIMGCLESEKSSRKSDPLWSNEGESKKFIENYANQLLVRAEEEAELGVSANVVIKLYLACAQSSQLLTLFGANSEENAKRIKYSKWKAVSVAKEVKEGTFGKTNPPAGSGENEEGGGEEDEFNLPQPPADNEEDYNSPNFGINSSSFNQQPPEPKPRTSISSAPAALEPEPEMDFANLSLTDSAAKKAELLCESALYAIKGGDFLTAVNSLKQTLQVLQKGATKNN